VFELHSDILLKHLKICQLQTQIQTPQEELVNNESPSSLHITLINILGANENKLSVTWYLITQKEQDFLEDQFLKLSFDQKSMND